MLHDSASLHRSVFFLSSLPKQGSSNTRKIWWCVSKKPNNMSSYSSRYPLTPLPCLNLYTTEQGLFSKQFYRSLTRRLLALHDCFVFVMACPSSFPVTSGHHKTTVGVEQLRTKINQSPAWSVVCKGKFNLEYISTSPQARSSSTPTSSVFYLISSPQLEQCMVSIKYVP